MSESRRFVLLPLLVLLLGMAPASPQSPTRARRPAAEAGTTVIPSRFLRRWDPLTVFFARDAGPAKAGPEDQPRRYVTLTPEQPGAWEWLDARTLQFRPAEPWPALARVAVRVEEPGGKSHDVTLATLMAAPTGSVPSDNAEGLAPFDEITLTFPEPLDAAALARMVSLELRPLPGVGSAGSRRLAASDLTIKTMERKTRADSASYGLRLGSPVPLGTRAVLHLRLSLDDDDKSSFKDLSFGTAEPFRLVSLGCRERPFPITPEGSRYTKDQAIRCQDGSRRLVAEFSATPKSLDPVAARNLVRFTPSVEGLTFVLRGRTLEIAGSFQRDTLYGVTVVPSPIQDTDGRRLDLSGESTAFVYFPRQASFLRFQRGQGVVERFGPQMVPLEGRGQERVDLRVYAVDPLDRSYWPFPESPVSLDESQRPPGPGEAPPPFTVPDRTLTPAELVTHLATLGSPPVSELVSLPLSRNGSSATFGLDLAPHLARLSGKEKPGTYLVGLRPLDSSSLRSWMRVQVTDLSLTVAEEPHAVRFHVASLTSGQSVAGARVRVEGSLQTQTAPPTWVVFADGLTDVDGSFSWNAPGPELQVQRSVRRIVVSKGDDVLVLDPERPPDGYADNQWSPSRGGWLDWVFGGLSSRGSQPVTLTHLYTERPIYRPEEEVHVHGTVRVRDHGTLRKLPLRAPVTLVVEGPNGLTFRHPVTETPAGDLYHAFSEKSLPTGEYRAHLEDKEHQAYGRVSFRMEAYRVPDFEVAIQAPDEVPLDHDFTASLTATYYAGGRVGGQGVQWRVTQFPYDWTPSRKGLEGFRFSSDGRFSRAERFSSSPRLEKQDETNDQGVSSINLNPAVEPTAQPRTYVLEATVTGADDQTVTATRRVTALPPFVLGVSAPRFLPKAVAIAPRLVVVGHDGKLLAGKDVTVRLLRRQWHSVLRASDFSDGLARYLTDVVDEKVSETTVKSAGEPLTLNLPIAKAGVYVVELSARDRLGRAQVVSVDLYAGGDDAITWPKPVTNVFSVVTDQTSYDPGATAAVVLKSPFQKARALAVIEAPEGNQYSWLDVVGGAATLRVPIRSTYVPRVPVHLVLMRGRLPGTSPGAGVAQDLGKPATLAATAWLDVNPVANRVDVKLQSPATARPGQKIDVTIKLSDPKGNPLAGEVTLWLVDQAVLALGKEQRLDPLPDFITPVRSYLLVRDTRNSVFGALAYAESPGGDEGAEGGLLDRTTVRKTFKTVPFYDPAIQVGPEGTKTVSIELPDNLTNFKLRAKATSGEARFGFGTGHLSVRLPVLVQPALPRFVRAGDELTGGALARVVEGKGGPATAEIRVDGITLEGPRKRELTLSEGRPERLELKLKVPTPEYDAEGNPTRDRVTFRVAVERTSDRASDAFEVSLPLLPDRERVSRRLLLDLVPGQAVEVPAVTDPTRPGTLRRSLLVSDQPGLVRMAAGLDTLLQYPYGCTEQRLGKARSLLALRKLRDLLKQKGTSEKEIERGVEVALETVEGAVDESGLVAFWPGSRGYVSLTAWSLQFLTEARQAGFSVDPKLEERLTGSLQKALRSDYSRFIDGESFVERAWALIALAQAGKLDAAYAAELARKPQFLKLEGAAEVVQAFARTKEKDSATVGLLTKQLWDGLITRLYQGREVYGGLQDGGWGGSGLILPSETRTLAEVTRAVARTTPQSPRLRVLVDGLVTLGRGDGWGSTNADASALLALSELLVPPFAGSRPHQVTIGADVLRISPEVPVGHLMLTKEAGALAVTLAPGDSAPGGGGVVLRADTSYVPAENGSETPAASNGFVVTREQLRVVGGPDDQPLEKRPLEKPGTTLALSVGDVVEEHVRVVNPKNRHHVAIVVPLAAGLEPLNPALATAPPEAKTKGSLTLAPSYVQLLDDRAAFFYDTLPEGTYDLYFRARATTVGLFQQPPAKAEMMYDGAVSGNSAGARVEVTRAPDK